MNCNKNKLLKAHYKGITLLKILKLFIMLVLIMMVLYCKIKEHHIQYAYGFVMINIVCVLYFVSRTLIVKRNIKKNNAVITEYSKKILLRHTIILIVYFIFSIILSVFFVYIKVIYDKNLEIWLWYALQLPMMYSDAVYLSGVVAIGNDSYCSGDYVIHYNLITECREVLSRNTNSGKMVLVELLNGKEKIGYDKFFLDEYYNIRKNIFQNNI